MSYDYVIIGGGIVGLSTGMAIMNNHPNAKLLILEKESELAKHQTGRNSGVLHSGIYYKPGSLKAKFAVEGREKLIQYCEQNNVEYDICGKIILATKEEELPYLENLYERAFQNGLTAEKLNQDDIKKAEPHANGIAAIKLPMTGITDYAKVTQSFGETVRRQGGEIRTEEEVIRIEENVDYLTIETKNHTYHTNYLINCAGLHSDRIARLAGEKPNMKIVPFKGEYYKLKPEKSYLVKNLIYPVPNPQFPFLGVHLTRMINGEIHAGPNAVLALKREGYSKISFNVKDTFETVTYPAFWKIARKHLKYGIDEMARSFNKKKFLKELQRLVPEIEYDDLIQVEPGIRAQALTKDGQLIDDFIIINGKRSIHVCNAPSPAATASIAIGEHIANTIKVRVKVG